MIYVNILGFRGYVPSSCTNRNIRLKGYLYTARSVAHVGISEVNPIMSIWQQQVVVDQIGDVGREPGGVKSRELGVAPL